MADETQVPTPSTPESKPSAPSVSQAPKKSNAVLVMLIVLGFLLVAAIGFFAGQSMSPQGTAPTPTVTQNVQETPTTEPTKQEETPTPSAQTTQSPAPSISQQVTPTVAQTQTTPTQTP